MSEKVLITAIIGGTLLLLAVVLALTIVLLVHPGSNSESIIVAALIGLPTILISAAGPIIAHWLTMHEKSK